MTLKHYQYYSQFLNDLESGRIATVTIVAGQRAEGEFRPGQQYKRYRVEVPPDPQLVDKLRKLAPQTEIAVTGAGIGDRLAGYITQLLLLAAFIFFAWWLIMRQMRSSGSQAISFGRSQAKLVGENWERVTFDDVAGMEEVKEELQEIVRFLRDREKYKRLGARIPKGVLLVGPPGCGKTLLARAVAGEAGVAFFYIAGSDFVEMFVGVGASRVRDLFNQAKQHLPAIIFIDELDAVGRVRGAGIGGGHDEREQTLNALLVEMDGFDPNANVIIMAATNRPDILDPALLRPGRFDRRIVVNNPDIREREAILRIHVRNKPLAEDVDLAALARRTSGFSGADLENVANEAALLAARRNKPVIEMEDFEEARERVIAGPERRSMVISDKEREIVAYHEAGHALVGMQLEDAPPVDKVTILPRAMSLGHTMVTPEEDRYMMTRDELMARITQALGGRAAEEIVLGSITTGAANDLEQVSELARRMVTEYGMSDELGPLQYGKKHGPIFLARELSEERNYSEDVARMIDEEVRRIVETSYDRAKEILESHRDKLEALAQALLEHETLDAEQVAALVETGKLPEEPPAAIPSEAQQEPGEQPQPEAEQTPRPGLSGPPLPETGAP
ncbi:MAG: ATP-dependent zinc metalloprotease FtsH [Armatimonadetes bacterium]|nr:ATP-dependent zinc metalloprotease FtsH [Armatimonadota bacterium]